MSDIKRARNSRGRPYKNPELAEYMQRWQQVRNQAILDDIKGSLAAIKERSDRHPMTRAAAQECVDNAYRNNPWIAALKCAARDYPSLPVAAKVLSAPWYDVPGETSADIVANDINAARGMLEGKNAEEILAELVKKKGVPRRQRKEMPAAVKAWILKTYGERA